MKSPAAKPEKRIIGWREWVGLPEFGVSHIKAKIDTGARTSALHAFDVRRIVVNGEDWVDFCVHPMQRDDTLVVPCRTRVVDRRFVTNSAGGRERRYVVATTIRIGEDVWPIELTLTNRDEMGFRMLIGRTAMHRRLIVDPARSFVASRVARPRKRRQRPMA